MASRLRIAWSASTTTTGTVGPAGRGGAGAAARARAPGVAEVVLEAGVAHVVVSLRARTERSSGRVGLEAVGAVRGQLGAVLARERPSSGSSWPAAARACSRPGSSVR